MDRSIAAITSAQALARALNAKVAVAVFDGSGRLVGSARMEGAPWLVEEAARTTAYTCAAIGMDTTKIAAMRGVSWIEDLLARQDLGLGGAGLLTRKAADGSRLAVGVSGASDEVDLACAQRAVASLEAEKVDGVTVDNAIFRQTMGALPTGVTVVTTSDLDDARPRGMTAGCLVSISLDPPLVGVFVSRTSQNYVHFLRCPGFGVSVLHTGQSDVARALAISTPTKFDGVSLDHSPSGYPLIPNSITRFECVTRATMEIGDHSLVCGEMVWAEEPQAVNPALISLGQGNFGLATPHPRAEPREVLTAATRCG